MKWYLFLVILSVFCGVFLAGCGEVFEEMIGVPQGEGGSDCPCADDGVGSMNDDDDDATPTAFIGWDDDDDDDTGDDDDDNDNDTSPDCQGWCADIPVECDSPPRDAAFTPYGQDYVYWPGVAGLVYLGGIGWHSGIGGLYFPSDAPGSDECPDGNWIRYEEFSQELALVRRICSNVQFDGAVFTYLVAPNDHCWAEAYPLE